MGKQIPLVIYKGGVRTEVGRASISDSGDVYAVVSKDHWPTVKDIISPGCELSIGPFYGSKTTRNSKDDN